MAKIRKVYTDIESSAAELQAATILLFAAHRDTWTAPMPPDPFGGSDNARTALVLLSLDEHSHVVAYGQESLVGTELFDAQIAAGFGGI